MQVKLRKTVEFVASINEIEGFVAIFAGRVTSLPSPDTTADEIQMQMEEAEVVNLIILLENLTSNRAIVF